jgi:hypothetical protein
MATLLIGTLLTARGLPLERIGALTVALLLPFTSTIADALLIGVVLIA